MENPVFGPGRQARLLGRAGECAVLDDVLSDVRQGQSRSLVLRGEAGIGKTALLEDMCERADGLLLVRGGGSECEAELAFAGLHHMCSQMVEDLAKALLKAETLDSADAYAAAGIPREAIAVGVAP